MISCPLKSNLLWRCHGCAVRLDQQQAASLTRTATLRLLLLQAFTSPFCPLTAKTMKQQPVAFWSFYGGQPNLSLRAIITRIWMCTRTQTKLYLCFSLSISEVRHNGKEPKTKLSRVFSGHRLALTKQGSKQQELRQWGFKRGPT